MAQPHLRARNAAILALVAIGLVVAGAVVFDTGQAPIAEAVIMVMPLAILAAIPLVYLVVKLSRGPSRSGLAMGVAYPVAVFGLLVIGLATEYQSGSDGAMDVVYSLVFFWFSIAWTLFLFAYLPAVARLLIMSWRPYRSSYAGLGPIAGWGAGLALVLGTCAAPTLAVLNDGADYRVDVVDNALARMNECIWRFAEAAPDGAFPDSLEQIRDVPYRRFVRSATRQPDDCRQQVERAGRYPFVVEYGARRGDPSSGRQHLFTLRFTERTRAGGRPRVTWIDETGLRHDGVMGQDRKVDSVRLSGPSSLHTMLLLQRYVDRYAASQGAYPVALASRESDRPGVLALDAGECSASQMDPDGSCVSMWGRVVIYRREADSAGRDGYTLVMVPVTFYDNERQQPVPSRTHFRDANGGWHSFGGLRPARATDPPPADDEMALASRSLDVGPSRR